MEPDEKDRLAQLLREFGDKASARTAFGEPVRIGEVTIIPVAEVAWDTGRGRMFRARFRPHFGPCPERREPPPGQVPEPPAGEEREVPPGEAGAMPPGPMHRPWGMGAGGIGGRLRVRPLAIVEIGPSGTRVRPIRNATKLILGLLALIGWNVFWVTKTIRAIHGGRWR